MDDIFSFFAYFPLLARDPSFRPCRSGTTSRVFALRSALPNVLLESDSIFTPAVLLWRDHISVSYPTVTTDVPAEGAGIREGRRFRRDTGCI